MEQGTTVLLPLLLLSLSLGVRSRRSDMEVSLGTQCQCNVRFPCELHRSDGRLASYVSRSDEHRAKDDPREAPCRGSAVAAVRAAARAAVAKVEGVMAVGAMVEAMKAVGRCRWRWRRLAERGSCRGGLQDCLGQIHGQILVIKGSVNTFIKQYSYKLISPQAFFYCPLPMLGRSAKATLRRPPCPAPP